MPIAGCETSCLTAPLTSPPKSRRKAQVEESKGRQFYCHHTQHTSNMSGRVPLFWQTPLRYWRWAARERPALFWSCVIGAAGPVTMVIVPPIRRAVGDPDAAPIPLTYPIPPGPRKQLTGYGDETEI